MGSSTVPRRLSPSCTHTDWLTVRAKHRTQDSCGLFQLLPAVAQNLLVLLQGTSQSILCWLNYKPKLKKMLLTLLLNRWGILVRFLSSLHSGTCANQSDQASLPTERGLGQKQLLHALICVSDHNFDQPVQQRNGKAAGEDVKRHRPCESAKNTSHRGFEERLSGARGCGTVPASRRAQQQRWVLDRQGTPGSFGLGQQDTASSCFGLMSATFLQVSGNCCAGRNSKTFAAQHFLGLYHIWTKSVSHID